VTAAALTLRRILAALPLDEAGHRALAQEYRAIAEAHEAVADTLARGPDASPLADTLPPPEPTP